MSSPSPQQLGPAGARFTFYLPTPPICDHHSQVPVDVPALVATNGNHWRKIVTIMAKLTCPTEDWRHYRDHQLLQLDEQICFGAQLETSGHWQLVCGKANWQRLGLDHQTFSPLDKQQRIWIKDRILLTPYPDYRQFPNDLITLLKHHLNSR